MISLTKLFSVCLLATILCNTSLNLLNASPTINSDINPIAKETLKIKSPACELTLIADVTHTTCSKYNGAITILPSGGSSYSYQWKYGETTQTISNLVGGTYEVTVTDENGCSASSSILVKSSKVFYSWISPGRESCNACNDGTLTAESYGASSLNYHWSTGDTTQTITNLSPGKYQLTVTSDEGCTSVASSYVNKHGCLPGLHLTGSYNISPLCEGYKGSTTVSVINGWPPISYEWSNGDTTATCTALPGFYTVTVTDSKGCFGSIKLAIGEAPIYFAIPHVLHQACPDQNNGAAYVEPIGIFPPFTYKWNSGATDSLIHGLAPGLYTVTVTDSTGCIYVDSVKIAVYEAVNLTFSQEDGKITVHGQGGLPPYTYLWNTGDTSAEINPGASGIYSVTVTDGSGCNYIGSYTLTSLKHYIYPQSKIRIYPVPAASIIQIILPPENNTELISIFDQNGTLLKQLQIKGKSTISLDISMLMPGIYRVFAFGNSSVIVTQFTKI